MDEETGERMETSVSVRVSAETKAKLEDLARREELKIADIIRRGLRWYLEEKATPAADARG